MLFEYYGFDSLKITFATMQLSFIKFLSLLFLSALIMGLSFPFSGSIFIFSFIGLIPLFLFNTELNDNKVKFKGLKRFLGNYTFFFTYNVFVTWWIYNASPEGGYMAFFFNSLLMVLPFHLYAFIDKHLGKTKGFVAFITLWLSFEHIDHVWDLSWPWISFGNIFGNQPMLIQWYEYSGIAGGTLWILLANLFGFMIVRNVWFKKEKLRLQTPLLTLVGLTILLPMVSSLILFYNYEEKIDPVNVVIVQPNIHPWVKDTNEPGEKWTMPEVTQINKILTLADSKITDQTDLVICPETAITSNVNEESIDYLGAVIKIKNFSSTHFNVPFLIGSSTHNKFTTSRPYPAQHVGEFWYENYNTSLLIDANNPIDIYHKSKLVLGPEKLPFVDIFPFIAELSVDLEGTSSGLTENGKAQLFEAKGVRFAPLICYESVYGEFVSNFTAIGAEFLCVITNDGWWHDSPGYKQHNMLSQIRAIENRRSVARSANTGISCIINQKGEIQERLDWDVEGVISSTLNKNNSVTFFMKYGDLIGRVSIFMVLGLLLYSLVTLLKFRKSKPSETLID